MLERDPSAEESRPSIDDLANQPLNSEAAAQEQVQEETEPRRHGHRMSIEKHLVGLWKMLGLGD